MFFINEDHYNFYQEKTAKLKTDSYLKALIYTIGICPDTRCRWDKIYDEKERTIVPEQLHQGWQTGTSLKVTRLAFQLYTDGTPTAYTGDNADQEDFKECQNYSVSDIFCCEYAPYFVEAVKLRYPEYFTNKTVYSDQDATVKELRAKADACTHYWSGKAKKNGDMVSCNKCGIIGHVIDGEIAYKRNDEICCDKI